MTQITMNIPEFSGTITFKKVWFSLAVMEGATMTTGNITEKRISVSVGGATATAVSNANTHTTSGENECIFFGANLTAHFVSNWTSGTSKTLDVSILINSAATTIAMVNVNVICYITYEYDDSQTTQIKTVFLPLDCPVGALGTSKPGSANATIPNLDTELPEASKTYRNMFIVVQGNVMASVAATDSTLSLQIDSLTAYTSQSLEMGAASDYWTRFVWNITSLGMTTNATHGFYIWGSVARHHHQQAYLVVTYEFDASQSNSCFVSCMVPMELSSPMGGVASTDALRGSIDFWIEEPTTITTKNLAFYVFWETNNVIAGLNMRVGTGSFVTYTDSGAVFCGSNGAMCRKDDAFTLARGKNTLSFDIYRTDSAILGGRVCGFWIINYTSGKPSQGYGAANHTIFWPLDFEWGGNANDDGTNASAVAFSIPDANYFLNCVGINFEYVSNGTGVPAGLNILAEKTSGEGNVSWLPVYTDISTTDSESGLYATYSGTRNIFKRFTGDPDTSRLDVETSRRWRYLMANGCSVFAFLQMIVTYHSITFTVSGNISDSNGGTVAIKGNRTDNGELVATTSRSGDGAYSLTFFDSTIPVMVTAIDESDPDDFTAVAIITPS